MISGKQQREDYLRPRLRPCRCQLAPDSVRLARRDAGNRDQEQTVDNRRMGRAVSRSCFEPAFPSFRPISHLSQRGTLYSGFDRCQEISSNRVDRAKEMRGGNRASRIKRDARHDFTLPR